MRIAIVHHWFVTRGGGERVAECIASLFPTAEIFTLLSGPRGLPASLASRPLHTSFLQHFPFARSHHRHMMPLYSKATESLDLRGFNLVLSSDSGPVKGVRLDPGAIHICYCHSPMRYLYDGYEAYRAQMRGQMRGLTRTLFTAAAARLRRWDIAAAARVDFFLANSHYVADRIQRFYSRESAVVHPPIDLARARLAGPGRHYLCAGRLVPYKQTELLLEACRRLNRPVCIAGDGPEYTRLREAHYPNATFLGELPTESLWQEYAECRALLFAADEDFGMVPLEAQACGRPVICYGKGGSLETVRATGPNPTGIYFDHQTVESAMDGILRFELQESSFRPEAAQAWAACFSTPAFLEKMRAFILDKVPDAAAYTVFH